MKDIGFGGKKKIAETLLRSAWRVSARSVGRILKERPIAQPPVPKGPTGPDLGRPASAATTRTTSGSSTSPATRHGKVGESHSLGLIDRFFRTLKDGLGLRSIRPWNLRDFKRRLTAALIHYAYLRPHTSLDASTPIETYYGIRRHVPHPVSPPRGRAGDPCAGIPFDFLFTRPREPGLPVPRRRSRLSHPLDAAAPVRRR